VELDRVFCKPDIGHGMLFGGVPMFVGDLKSLLPLWKNLAQNRRYEPYVGTQDLLEFETRFTNEGLTFIAVTLPTIGKALDRYHSLGEWVAPEHFKCLETTIKPGFFGVGEDQLFKIPLFLRIAIIKAIEGDSLAVDCVRQLTLIFYKLEVPYGPEKERQYLDSFKSTDRDLDSIFSGNDPSQDLLLKRMKQLIARVLVNEDPTDIVPSHGGGSTACRTPNWKKHHRRLMYYEKLDEVYPYSDYFFNSSTHLADEMQRLQEAENMGVPQARVLLVPKDSRGPRVISCEPAELMFIQQGIMRKLYGILENHRLTRGFVNFEEQRINRMLAEQASKDGGLATLDLSDASDRVSLELVRRVFPANWFRCLNACRSEDTVLPTGEVITLNKFAPMGSSCCFPVEALVFWACAVASIFPYGRISEKKIPPVWVYGDDIVIEPEYFELVTRGLECVGLKVNKDKSYWRGPFRESCGGDYHCGVDVTPVRVRKFLSKSRTSLATNADLANSFIAKFGYADATSVISIIETAGGYVYPRSELSLPATIRTSPGVSNTIFRTRFNRELQRMEHRILVPVSISKRRSPPNWEELFRKQLIQARYRFRSLAHLTSEEVQAVFPAASQVSILLVIDDRSFETAHHHQYENHVAIRDSKQKPGWYMDPHSISSKWAWTWLG
jgi:hypothetical protein